MNWILVFTVITGVLHLICKSKCSVHTLQFFKIKHVCLLLFGYLVPTVKYAVQYINVNSALYCYNDFDFAEVKLQACLHYLGTMSLADLGGHAPPMGPNSFVFAYIFGEKCLRRRSTPPLREILDPPLVSILTMYTLADLGGRARCTPPYGTQFFRFHIHFW